MGRKKSGKKNKNRKTQQVGFFRRNVPYMIGLVVIFWVIYGLLYAVDIYDSDSDSYTSDGENVEYTGSNGNFYAIDESGVLSADTVSYIEEQGKELCDETKAQIVVDILPNTGDSDLFDYSMELFKENGYGDEQQDNGLLLLITTDEIHARITTGYGLEGCLPDGKCGRILDTYTMDALNSGDYDGAVRNTWNALATVVYQEYGLTPPDAVYDSAIAADSADDAAEDDAAADESINDADDIETRMGMTIFLWLGAAIFLTVVRLLFRDDTKVNPYSGWVGRWLSSDSSGDSYGGSSGGGGGSCGGGGSSGGGGAGR